MAKHATDGLLTTVAIVALTINAIIDTKEIGRLRERVRALEAASPPVTAEDSTTSSQSPPHNATIEAHP